MRIMITGDRTPAMIYPGMVAVEMLRQINRGNTILTGENAGVEEIVRALANEAEIEVEVIPNPDERLENGKVDWDARHRALDEDVVVFALHVDPQASSITRSLLEVLPEERVELRTPVDLLA